MGQPIKKNIINTYGEEIAKKPIYTLLCDGNSLLKVAMRDETLNQDGIHVGGIFQFLLQLRKLITQRDWNFVYCFFDDTYSGILRYNLYPQYKANRDKHYEDFATSDYMKELNRKVSAMYSYFKKKQAKTAEEKQKVDEDEAFKRERERLLYYFNELFIRWMMDENGTESDDLIAYYIKHKKPEEKIVIVSTDMDLTQLLSDDVYIYNPHLHKNITSLNFKKEFGYPYTNVLPKKIMCGDVSDNISNIAGLSEKKFFEIIPEAKERGVTIEEVIEKAKLINEERTKEKKKPLKVCENIINGVANKEYNGDFYEINRKIIDLGSPMLTPEAEEELTNMMYAPQDIEDRSFSNLYKLIQEDKIINLMDENHFSSFFSPFRPFIEKEKKYFKEENK